MKIERKGDWLSAQVGDELVMMSAESGAYLGLNEGLQSRFERRRVSLKGYEGDSTAWGISFEGLRAGLV